MLRFAMERVMLKDAWLDYRSWAARARDLQRRSRNAARGVVVLACVAAVLGALATLTAGLDGCGRIFAILAAIAAALMPIVGRDIMAIGNEGKWIKARATAEQIKSECFR